MDASMIPKMAVAIYNKVMSISQVNVDPVLNEPSTGNLDIAFLDGRVHEIPFTSLTTAQDIRHALGGEIPAEGILRLFMADGTPLTEGPVLQQGIQAGDTLSVVVESSMCRWQEAEGGEIKDDGAIVASAGSRKLWAIGTPIQGGAVKITVETHQEGNGAGLCIGVAEPLSGQAWMIPLFDGGMGIVEDFRRSIDYQEVSEPTRTKGFGKCGGICGVQCIFQVDPTKGALQITTEMCDDTQMTGFPSGLELPDVLCPYVSFDTYSGEVRLG